DRRPRTNVKNISLDISKNTNTQRKPRTDEKTNQVKGVQYHECEGYGHIRTKCATFLKKQKKGLTVSWSEEDSEGEVETEAAKHITALTGICMSDTKSCDEDISYEELVASYKELCIKSEEVCRTLEKQKKIIAQLQAERYDNLSKISELNNE
ncbi:gag-pol polyprotein, partial [Trifolium medium]|nr:gag-pol polyprotein [Trifolium medium]